MIEVRKAESDADLEAFIRIRRALLPNESGGTIELYRDQLRDRPDVRLVVADIDGEVVGHGVVQLSDMGDRFSLKVRVLPRSRRRGVGTAIVRDLVAHASTFGYENIATHLEEESARPFAERFGFREVDRQVEQAKLLGNEPQPVLLDGIEVVSVAERPSLLRDAYPLACQGYEDLATERPIHVPLHDWLRDEATLPGGSFAALADGEIVGYSGLVRHDNDGVAEDGLTVVRRDWRRRGLARTLKQKELAWAAVNGFREVVTWTQRGNEGMRKLNEQLGYEYRDVTITMLASLPLEGID